VEGGFGGGIHLVGVKGETERLCEIRGELPVPVGGFASQPVVKVSGVEDQAKFRGASGKGAGQGHGIGTAREAYGETEAGKRQRSHELMVNR
jgi:hypothetical protein